MPVFRHQPQEELGQDVNGCHVQIDQSQFPVQVRLQEEPVDPHPCVVDHKIDVILSCQSAGFFVKLEALLPPGKVRRDHDDISVRIFFQDLPADLLQDFLSSGGQDQVIASAGQILSDLKSYSGAGACNKCIHALSSPYALSSAADQSMGQGSVK